mgnify:CR=1 FL=1
MARGLKNLRELPEDRFNQAMNLANLIRSMLNEIEVFIKKIIEDNFSEDIIINMSTRITLSNNGTIVNIEVYNSLTDTFVIYDMTLADLLKYSVSKTLEPLMNEKVPKMVDKSIHCKRSSNTNRVYLETCFK